MNLIDLLTLVLVALAFAAGYGFGVYRRANPVDAGWGERAHYGVVTEENSRETQAKRTVSERRL